MAVAALAQALEEAFRRCRDMDAALDKRLSLLAAAVRDISPSFADAVDRLILRLSETHVGEAAPGIGQEMPSFLLPDENGRLTSLAELIEGGPVAITFHRGHWCPYCRINTHALAALQRDLVRSGCRIVAILPDRQQFARRLKIESQASFPVLVDIDNGYALSLNLVFWVGDEMASFILASGIDVPDYQGNASWMLPIPATFVVGADALVKARFVDPDYRTRMSVETLRAALLDAR
jgi:peroxiredoxin